MHGIFVTVAERPVAAPLTLNVGGATLAATPQLVGDGVSLGAGLGVTGRF